MREIVSRNGSLRAGFFRDVRKVDRARSVISRKETKLLMRILHEGVALGLFEVSSIKECAIIITNSIQGFDVPYIRNSLTEYGIDKSDMSRMITDLILYGVKRRGNEE